MLVDTLDYDLPEALIAQTPSAARDGARLLWVERHGERLAHLQVAALAQHLSPCLMVVNDTQVFAARLQGRRPSGGQVEALLLQAHARSRTAETWTALMRPSKALKAGMTLHFGTDGALAAEVLAPKGAGQWRLKLHPARAAAAPGPELPGQGAAGNEAAPVTQDRAMSVAELRQAAGQLPLPPYIRRAPTLDDQARYQTVFAQHEGSVAAPTAGLHFTEALLARLEAAGCQRVSLTLHVGLGTFLPVRSADLTHHSMHREHYSIPPETVQAIARAKAEGRPVLAVGTTVVRALEAAARQPGGLEPGPGATDLCIYPPFDFRVVDQLLTNFHLPKSTLLALVMAFGGSETVRTAYRAAVAQRYRFYSYGDAMWLARTPPRQAASAHPRPKHMPPKHSPEEASP
ncbi:MAG: S-adenosylmethionine:tRNA ribosyltransferase-isomerase [Polyangiales bacterium]